MVPFIICLLQEVSNKQTESCLDVVVFLASSHAGHNFPENHHVDFMKYCISVGIGPIAPGRGEMLQQHMIGGLAINSPPFFQNKIVNDLVNAN
jgi:hypothetical protein